MHQYPYCDESDKKIDELEKERALMMSLRSDEKLSRLYYCCSNDGYRQNIYDKLFVFNKRLLTTNGHVFFSARNDRGVEDGSYSLMSVIHGKNIKSKSNIGGSNFLSIINDVNRNNVWNCIPQYRYDPEKNHVYLNHKGFHDQKPEGFSVCLNPEYLAVISGEFVNAYVGNEISPILFAPMSYSLEQVLSDDYLGWYYVVMPFRG